MKTQPTRRGPKAAPKASHKPATARKAPAATKPTPAPVKADYAETLDDGTQKLIGAGLKGTIAALKAHLTRLENAITDDDTAGQAKAEAYRSRIAQLVANTGAALPAPADVVH
jgi:hypothetical protein